MACSKIVGLEVSPVTENSSIYRFRAPEWSMSRVMLSSQMLWPRLCSSWVAFMNHLFHSGQRVSHDLPRLGDNGFQMGFALKAFGVNLVDVFRSRRPRGEPAGGGDHFEPADGGVIARGAGQFGCDRFSRQRGFLYVSGR